MALLDDIAHFLVDSTSALTLLSGTAGAGNLVKARLIDNVKTPDTLIALYETAGWQPQWAMSSGTTSPIWDVCGLQSVTRSTSYATARTHAQRVFRILDDVANRALPHTSSGTWYYRIAAVGPPFSIGQDSNGRYLTSCNFDVTKARA